MSGTGGSGARASFGQSAPRLARAMSRGIDGRIVRLRRDSLPGGCICFRASRILLRPMRPLILGLLLSVLAAPLRAADRPNIVFIMADDHAAQAIGAYGSRVNQTPHIDQLA